ncbi:MAG: putative amidophosphoribosyltransferase [Parcubacteria group bacterium GW2011_GWA1_53_13]|nr:MAG: putative amidophosphoribosyltransferase [Parcubacteria group bacterium GW2011_GWA1_53_13]
MLEKLRDGVLEVAFPVVCVSCGTEGKYICEKCEVFLGEASFICPICLRASFAGERHLACQHRHGLNGLASIWEYEGAVQRLLHCIKYDGVVHAIEEIIERACGSMALDQKRFCTFLSFLFSPDTLVTYVPMHSRKEKRRGFNQTELLANALAKQTKSAVACLLEKTKETKPQVDLDKEERLYNMKGSFAISSGTLSVPITTLSVVLVDDVWTTGATMKECCKILKKAGIQEVWGFTLARTV